MFPLPVAHLPIVYPLLSLSPISTRYYTHACSMIYEYIIIVQSERGDSVPWSTNDDWPVFDVAEHREQSETFGKPKRVRWIGENSGVAGKGAGKKLCGFSKKPFDRSKPMYEIEKYLELKIKTGWLNVFRVKERSRLTPRRSNGIAITWKTFRMTWQFTRNSFEE